MTMCWSYITYHFNNKDSYKIHNFILAFNIWFYLNCVPKCPISSLILKTFWGCILPTSLTYRATFGVEQNPFGWNTFSEWSTRKTDWPQDTFGKVCNTITIVKFGSCLEHSSQHVSLLHYSKVKLSCCGCVTVARHIDTGTGQQLLWKPFNNPKQIPAMITE